jgi:GNAT superfamily N-acetyltransferase
MLTPRVISEAELDRTVDAAIKAGLVECFPADADMFSRTRAWHGSAPTFTALVEDDARRVVAHVGVVMRTIRAGETALTVAGVQNVFVVSPHRKTGLADHVMTAAMDEARARNLDGGLLFCLPVLTRIYARTGWQLLSPRPVWATGESQGRYLLDDKNVLMFLPMKCATFPDGPIDLNGDDW